MRKNLLVLLILASSFTLSFGQSIKLIDSFDTTVGDTTYQLNVEGALSYLNISQSTDKKEGTSALEMKARIGAYHEWGSYSQLIKRIPDTEPKWDWSTSDSLSIWIKVVNPPTVPANMVFRIHLVDRPTATDPIEEFIYENTTIVDATTDWVNLKIALKERFTDGTTVPNDSGFVIMPSTWGGGTYNNHKFDVDKIVGFNIGLITTGYTPGVNLPADSLTILVDGFQRFGLKSVPAIIFNGMTVPSTFNQWSWGGCTFDLITGAGYTPGTNAFKWGLGSDAWQGFGWDIAPSFNLGGSWPQDSLKIKVKSDPGVGSIRLQFESAAGKKGYNFDPIGDGEWHSYSFPLREFTLRDGTTDFDSTNIIKFGAMTEGNAVQGKVIYFTDIWTGNPVFDVIPPAAPTGVTVTPSSFVNLVTWSDVPAETGETYSIYYSKNPISDLNASGVEVVKLKVAEATQLSEHLLRAPAVDQSVAYYYAVICTDNAGNISPVAVSSGSTTNTAKGVTTLSLNAPASFVADGDLTEWASVPTQHIALSDGTAFLVTNSTVENDADCSALTYLAVDNNYLYVAFDVEDDIFSFNPALDSYKNDCADLYLGLYNWRGAPHAGYQRGAQPDYHFRFAKNQVLLDGGVDSVLLPGANYYFEEKFPSGYIIEAKISLADLAASMNDDVFVPTDGFRVPIDYALNDADATGEREGILTYSPFNEDKSWQSPSRWLYTWVGTRWDPTAVNDNFETVTNYNLVQNYPNPFNPSTTIRYTIEKSGLVSLRVYDVLGRLVSTLVNQNQNAGTHSISFNASNLSSGIYFYKLESGSFQSIKKMILVK